MPWTLAAIDVNWASNSAVPHPKLTTFLFRAFILYLFIRLAKELVCGVLPLAYSSGSHSRGSRVIFCSDVVAGSMPLRAENRQSVMSVSFFISDPFFCDIFYL